MHTLHWPARDALVPIAIKVVDLERLLLAPRHRATFASAWNWADAYLRATLGRAAPRYRFLRQVMPTPTPTLTLTLNRTLTLTLTLSQAMMARRGLLLLDGMDEGGLGKLSFRLG